MVSLLVGALPALVKPETREFNLFSVMRHGTHEKQLSNVFGWVLDASGSHAFGDLGLRIFLEAVNRAQPNTEPIAAGVFGVTQEINTSEPGQPKDIADIVLTGADAILVVENYYTSDGHGHEYDRYLKFGARSGLRSTVVLLCRFFDEERLSPEWKQSSVVTYDSVLNPLFDQLADDEQYRTDHPREFAFIEQIHQYFTKGRAVNDDLLELISVMCEVGEADRYRNGREVDAEAFADHFRDIAKERFAQSRDLLQRVKAQLTDYAKRVLIPQLGDLPGEVRFETASAKYNGIYQWTVNCYPPKVVVAAVEAGSDDGGPGVVQLKFGPSAWWANEKEPKSWPRTVPPNEADYSKIFVTWNKEIRQSKVSLKQVLEGLDDSDTTLRDLIVDMVASR